MTDQKIAEKAREYSSATYTSPDYNYQNQDAISDFTAGANWMHSELSAEVERMREALDQALSYLNSFKSEWEEGEEMVSFFITKALKK